MADENPPLNADLSDDDTSSQSSDGSASAADSIIQPPPSTVLQTVNIRHHVPVELSLTESNYAEWRDFFDFFIGKFGLTSHLTVAPTSANRHDSDWNMVDKCIISWLYNSISKDVCAIVRSPKATAYKI
jgi:hypothetical protein